MFAQGVSDSNIVIKCNECEVETEDIHCNRGGSCKVKDGESTGRYVCASFTTATTCLPGCLPARLSVFVGACDWETVDRPPKMKIRPLPPLLSVANAVMAASGPCVSTVRRAAR